ncbi:hypothetical protein T4B_270, partial [Trichinella pseudospiralis]
LLQRSIRYCSELVQWARVNIKSFFCPQFFNQQRSERRATAVRLGLCFICLCEGQTSQRCMMKQQGWRSHHLFTKMAQNRRTSQPNASNNPTTFPGKKTRSEPSKETTPRVLLVNSNSVPYSVRNRFWCKRTTTNVQLPVRQHC